MGRLGGVLAVVLLLAGCVGDADQPEPEVKPPAGVSVSLAQWRSDEAMHTLQVAVRNDSDTPVYFADVQLVTESFKVLPPHRVDSTLGRTPRTDFQIPYGSARCQPDRVPNVRPAAVVAHLRVGDGPLREVRFDLPHPDPLLRELVRVECSAYLVTRVAEFAFGTEWARVGDRLHGTLAITRRADSEAVTVVRFGDTTHYTFRPLRDADPVAVLAADADRVDVPIRVRALRCDPHGFADAKKAFIFEVTAAVGEEEPRELTFIPPKPTQRVLLGYARAMCGF